MHICDTYNCDYLQHTTFRFYLIDFQLNTYSLNKKVNIQMVPSITQNKTKNKQICTKKLKKSCMLCSIQCLYPFIYTHVFKCQAFCKEFMEGSHTISGKKKIAALGKNAKFMHFEKYKNE